VWGARHGMAVGLAERAATAPPLPGVVGERLGAPAPRLRLRTAALFDASAPSGSSSSTSSCGQVLCRSDAPSQVRGELGKVRNGP